VLDSYQDLLVAMTDWSLIVLTDAIAVKDVVKRSCGGVCRYAGCKMSSAKVTAQHPAACMYVCGLHQSITTPDLGCWALLRQ
jgi:hypothetical protein